MAKQNKPAIRFKGFTDAWEQRKLEDYLTVSAEKNTDNLYTKKDVLSVSGDFGVVNQIEFQGRSFAGASVSNYGVVHTGDVVYTKSPLKANPYGIIKANKGKPGIVSVLYGVYHTRENANADFIQMYFEQDARLNNYLRPLVNKGAKNTLLISDTDALEGEVCLAPTFDEQKAIGQFFDSLDNLITLHQRKFDKLQVLKKAMLEKMFPKNGSSVPEIRFKGFTDAWEQRKLGDNIVEYTEVTTENNQYPPLTSSRKGIFLQTEYFAGNQIASDDNTGYNIVPYGYFTYRHMSDDEVFHFNINDIVEKGIVSTLYPVFTTDENLDSRYLQYQLNYGHEFAKFAILQKQGGSRTYMYLNKLRQLHLTMPNHVEEQKAISSFFMNLDHLITLHQRELEKLQNIKKSMLEKMFV